MKLSSLVKKLNAMQAPSEVATNNGFNMSLVFTLNGLRFSAEYTAESYNVSCYNTVLGYDDLSQEKSRRFFDNLNQVVRYAERRGQTPSAHSLTV
jgi:hypothetical protein